MRSESKVRADKLAAIASSLSMVCWIFAQDYLITVKLVVQEHNLAMTLGTNINNDPAAQMGKSGANHQNLSGKLRDTAPPAKAIADLNELKLDDW